MPIPLCYKRRQIIYNDHNHITAEFVFDHIDRKAVKIMKWVVAEKGLNKLNQLTDATLKLEGTSVISKYTMFEFTVCRNGKERKYYSQTVTKNYTINNKKISQG